MSLVLISTFAVPLSVQAGKLPDRFTLGQYLPGDAWIYFHMVHNPEREWLNDRWAEVFQALKDSGIHQDILSLVLSALPEAQRAAQQDTLQRLGHLLAEVQWTRLVGREFAFAERMSVGPIGVDYYVLMRGDPGSGKTNFPPLVALFRELDALGGEMITYKPLSQKDDFSHGLLQIGTEQATHVNFHLFRRGDIIGLVSDDDSMKDVIQRVQGKVDSHAIVASPRFQEALGRITTPEDGVLFFDMKRFLKSVTQMTHKTIGEGPEEATTPAGKVALLVRQFCDTCNVMDYKIIGFDTEGRRQRSHTVIRLQRGKEKCRLAYAVLKRRPFKRFDQYIPADAMSFRLSGSIDLEQLYSVILDFVKKAVPDGEKLIAQWNDKLASLGFDPQRDFFDWWSGETISITLPPAVVTPMSRSDFVYMVRVKDARIASQKIDALIQWVNGALQQMGVQQGLTVSPAPVSVEGFKALSHPMLMMIGSPVIGVHDGWLVYGSSANAVSKCLAVSEKQAPSIATNARFKKEGLIPKGPVLSCAFTDTSNFGRETAGQLAMAGMIGGMITGSMPDEPGQKETKKTIQSVFAILMKLGPVFQKIDFLSSEADMTEYDGDLNVTTHSVVTYKSADNTPSIKTATRR